jgi:outer membrane lipoprotein-sorting protein
VSSVHYLLKILCPSLCLILLGLFISSCTTVSPEPTPLVILPSANQALKHLEDRRLFVRSFSMQGEIMLRGDRGEISGEHVIQGAYPNKLRAEVMGPFGRPVLLLISDGRWLAVLDYRANKAYMGQASQRNLARFVGLPLSVEGVYALLTGSVIVAPGAENIHLSAGPEPDLASLKLVYTGGEMDQKLLFDPASYSIHQALLHEHGEAVDLEVAFEDFQKGVSFSYPLKVELKDRGGRTLLLSSDSLRINPPQKADIFKPQLPKGVPVELLP